MSNPLARYSTNQLIEELARRRNESNSRKPIEFYCQDCKHFKFWTKNNDAPDTYNPCEMGHKMSFKMPEGYSETDYGFYRRVCPDRDNREEAKE